MKEPVRYSSVLQDFIHPLLNEKDTDEIFLSKFKVAEVIWNYCIAKEFHLPVFAELEKIITQQNDLDREMKLVFDTFVESKETYFKQYKNFITKVEYRIKADGSKSLYVESVHPSEFLKNNFMSKLGSKEKPAVVRVQTEERAKELLEICEQNGWQVIVGIEPEKEENTSDVRKLQKGLGLVSKFQMPPSKNAPCSCGSGKQYKRCCGK